MARSLEKWSRVQVRALIRFLWAKNVAASEIHRQIIEVYGDKAMSRQQVAKWCRSYQAGREHVKNRNMEASGRPSSSRTDFNTARVEEIIQTDRQVTVREIAAELDLNYGNVQPMSCDIPKFVPAGFHVRCPRSIRPLE
ncbi:protein GVQW3-like [Stegodyphus dumicola]|uniref:protein GVQW3-like n=1 Tax=Stegodyphus dumicola TaxID=202533 RepID=UPI0015B35124|nr:protein GVQW3-like [Stegodyphus dumicola]